MPPGSVSSFPGTPEGVRVVVRLPALLVLLLAVLFSATMAMPASATGGGHDEAVASLATGDDEPLDDTIIVTGPAGCETCTVFDGAQWCAETMMCYIPPLDGNDDHRYDHHHHNNGSLGDAGITSTPDPSSMSRHDELWLKAKRNCRDECGGTECGGLVQCFAKANQTCGACVFVGGWWSEDAGACFIGSENTPEVRTNCILGDGSNVCLRREPQCPACERVQKPLRCTPQVAVVVVASVITAGFLALFAWTCWRAEHRSHFAELVAAGERPSHKGTPMCTPETNPADPRKAGKTARATFHTPPQLGTGVAVESNRTASIVGAPGGFGINASITTASSGARATRANDTGLLPQVTMTPSGGATVVHTPRGGCGGAAKSGTSPSQQMAQRREADAANARRRSSSTTLPPLPKRAAISPPMAAGGGEAPLAPDYRSTPTSGEGDVSSARPSDVTVPHRRNQAGMGESEPRKDAGPSYAMSPRAE